MQQHLVGKKESHFDASGLSLCAESRQKRNQMRAYAPTYLPLCDVQVSHLPCKLAQPPRNNCWHDNR